MTTIKIFLPQYLLILQKNCRYQKIVRTFFSEFASTIFDLSRNFNFFITHEQKLFEQFDKINAISLKLLKPK